MDKPNIKDNVFKTTAGAARTFITLMSEVRKDET